MWPASALTAAVVVLSAVPAWQFTHWQWIALALATPVVLGFGAPVHGAASAALRRGRVGVDVLVAAGPLAALGWSVYALLAGDALDPDVTRSLTDRTGALDVAAALTVVALSGVGADAERREVAGLGLLVPGTATAVLGLGLGAGAGAGAVAGAVAVLVAGCPCALWVVARWAAPPTAGGTAVRDVDSPEVLRLAAALCAAHPDDPIARAVTDAAGPDLPGVSDPDGTPDTGLCGVVSELRGDVVVAHAVLAGPAQWLAAHGVEAPDGDGQVLVAWDGVPRGRLDVVQIPPRDARSTRIGRYLAVTGALVGATLAAVGVLGPATAGVVPLVVTALVAVLVGGAAAIRPGRRHLIEATPG